jgi:hypothetical protein
LSLGKSPSNAELTNTDAALAAAQHDHASDSSQLHDQYNAAAKAQASSVAAQKENVTAAAKIVEQRQAQMDEQQFKLDQTMQNGPRQLPASS